MTYNFCVFAALSELLNGVGVFHVVHRDCVHHHYSIVLPAEETRAETHFTANCGTGVGLIRHLVCVGLGEGLVRDW